MDGSEFLQGLDVSEPHHRSFPSSERLMGMLGSIVEPSSTVLTLQDANLFHRGAMAGWP